MPIFEKAAGDWVAEEAFALAAVICTSIRSKEDYPVGLFRAGEDGLLLLGCFILGARWVVGKGGPSLHGGLAV